METKTPRTGSCSVCQLNHSKKTCDKKQQELNAQQLGDLMQYIHVHILTKDNKLSAGDYAGLVERKPGPAHGKDFLSQYAGSPGWNYVLLLLKEHLAIRTAPLDYASVFAWAQAISRFEIEYIPGKIPDAILALAMQQQQQPNMFSQHMIEE